MNIFKDLKSNENVEKYDCWIVNNNVGEYEFFNNHPIDKNDFGNGFQIYGTNNSEKKVIVQLTNSCCLFKINKNGEKKGCFSLGKKFSEDKKTGLFKVDDSIDIEYEYNGNYLGKIINKFLFLFFIYIIKIFFFINYSITLSIGYNIVKYKNPSAFFRLKSPY